MKRHTNKCLAMFSGAEFWQTVGSEMGRGHRKFGKFNSAHELASVLREEYEEFWDSVKADDPDPVELIHVAAVALRGALELCSQARLEMEQRGGQ